MRNSEKLKYKTFLSTFPESKNLADDESELKIHLSNL